MHVLILVERIETVASGYSHEQRLVKWLGLISPLIVIACVPVIHRYLMTVLYLQPAAESWDLSAAYRSRLSLGAALMIPACLGVWWIGLKLQPLLDRSRIPWAAVLTVIAIPICSLPFHSSRITWFFVEWVIPRTPNPSFARNTLFWEQRNFESVGADKAAINIGLVGSSQTYQGFDLEVLKLNLPNDRFEKNCLAGFGPMQYPFLLDRIHERQFDLMVCQLSEFDFYREDTVPVSRLRWGASDRGVAALCAELSGSERWSNRGELADLWFAAHVPLWRQRDHIRRTVLDYWWKKSNPQINHSISEVALADAPGLAEAIEHLQQNVGQKKLVNANFRCFEFFAATLKARGIRLLVLEGQVHPDARKAYDVSGMQAKTRQSLQAMSETHEFRFVDRSAQPRFTADDFADAYHLNTQGRKSFTNFLVQLLKSAEGSSF